MGRSGYLLLWIWCCLIFHHPPLGYADGSVPVFVSIVPQKYFVKKIGGDFVDVSVMVPPGATPATYEPKPKQMKALSTAKVYFAVGVPFEASWLKNFAAVNPKMLIVHTEKGVEKKPMKTYRRSEKNEKRVDAPRTDAHAAEHHHGILDPHIWLSPSCVIIQARNILAALLKIDPIHASVYEANYKAFIIELVDLDAEIRDIFKGQHRAPKFMVFHPAWGYFADDYGLEQIPIEMEGKEPKPSQLKDLIDEANALKIKVIFVQPQFSIKNAEVIAKAIGGKVVSADPLALDWAENLRNQAKAFKTFSRSYK